MNDGRINEFDDKEMAVMSCLIQSALALENMKFSLPEEYEEAQYTRFFHELSHL